MCKPTIPFNVNDYVRVKLTDRGRELLKADHERIFANNLERYPWQDKKEDAEGYSAWQLWDLMQRFGPHIHLGGLLPFDPQILVEVKP